MGNMKYQYASKNQWTEQFVKKQKPRGEGEILYCRYFR